MTKRTVGQKQDTSQSAKFKEAARGIGCDEDEAAFEERLKKIAKAPPPVSPKPKAKQSPK